MENIKHDPSVLLGYCLSALKQITEHKDEAGYNLTKQELTYRLCNSIVTAQRAIEFCKQNGATL